MIHLPDKISLPHDSARITIILRLGPLKWFPLFENSVSIRTEHIFHFFFGKVGFTVAEAFFCDYFALFWGGVRVMGVISGGREER